MSKNFNRKKLVIATTSTICIVCVAILITVLGGINTSNKIVNNQSRAKDVTVNDIQKEVKVEPNKAESNEPQIEPSVVVSSIKESTTKENEITNAKDIQLTKVTEKPLAPDKPTTAVDTDKPHDKPTDPILTNPEKKPSVTVKPVEPTKPTAEKPSGGATNSKGETYVPGFGWIKSSGPNQQIDSHSDGDWNKQIGNMN